jgi:hypothetical protein
LLDDAHQVAVGEEAAALGDDAGVGRQAGAGELDAVADAASGLHLALRDPVVGPTCITYEKPSRSHSTADCGSVVAWDAPSSNSPRANMPARRLPPGGTST